MNTSKYQLSKVAGTAASLKNQGNFKTAIVHLYNSRCTAISKESAKVAPSIKNKTNNAPLVELTAVVKKAASAYGNESFNRSRDFSTTSMQNLSLRPHIAKSKNFIFEVSRSIQDELMPIDQATKDLIRCDKQNRSEPKANNQFYNSNYPAQDVGLPKQIKPIKRKGLLSKSAVMLNAKDQSSSRSSRTAMMNSKYKSISERFPYAVSERTGGDRHDNRYTPPIKHLSKICKDMKANYSASPNEGIMFATKRQSHSVGKASTVDTRYVQPKKEIEVLGNIMRKPLNTKQQATVENSKKQAKQMEKAKESMGNRTNANTGKNERVPTPKFDPRQFEDQVNVQTRAPAQKEATLRSEKLQGEESESDDDEVDDYVGLLTKNSLKKYGESEAEKLAKTPNNVRTTNVQITKPYNNDYMLKKRSQSLPYKKSYGQESATSRMASLSDMRSSHAKHLIRLKKSAA